MSVNKVILVGRLGRDPETRFTSGGQAVANFSVATDESYKDRNGERQKRTEWHKIVVWGKQAEIAQQYLKKGSLVFIEGRIQSREWQDKEGQKRTSFEIVASNFRMLGGRGDGMAAGASAGGGSSARSGGDDFDHSAAPSEDFGPASGPEISATSGPERRLRCRRCPRPSQPGTPFSRMAFNHRSGTQPDNTRFSLCSSLQLF